MMQIQTADGMKPLPRKWSFWQHKKNRTVYQVTEISNLGEKQGDYPVTISYMGPDGRPWSMVASKWYDKMDPVTTMLTKLLHQYEGQVLTPSVIRALTGIWQNLMLQNEVDMGPRVLKFKSSPVYTPGQQEPEDEGI